MHASLAAMHWNTDFGVDSPLSHLPSVLRLFTDDLAILPTLISSRPCAVEPGAESASPTAQGSGAAGAPQGWRGRCRRGGHGRHHPHGRRRPQEAWPQAQEIGAARRGGELSSLPPAALRSAVKLLRNLVLTCMRACGGNAATMLRSSARVSVRWQDANRSDRTGP